MDGDGILDAVAQGATYDTVAPSHWDVFRGDGTGAFERVPHTFMGRSAKDGFINAAQSRGGNSYGLPPPAPYAYNTAGTVDLNGDGLPDHWHVGSALDVWSPIQNRALMEV
jgi:hypothetical protein